MEISRYATRLKPSSAILPSGRPLTGTSATAAESGTTQGASSSELALLSGTQFPRDLPQEPDDARLTGGTRSLSRRLLALNVPVLAPSLAVVRKKAASIPRQRTHEDLTKKQIGSDRARNPLTA